MRIDRGDEIRLDGIKVLVIDDEEDSVTLSGESSTAGVGSDANSMNEALAEQHFLRTSS
jgi:hypothetical protein